MTKLKLLKAIVVLFALGGGVTLAGMLVGTGLPEVLSRLMGN